MKKVILWGIIFILAFAPCFVFAAGFDQYGYYINTAGQASYTFIPDYPEYLSGYLDRPMSPYIFYQPELAKAELADKAPLIFTPQLANNPEKDKLFCQDAQIFADGRYIMDNKNRIKPVCAKEVELIETENNSKPKNYYTNLPINNSKIEKVYPYHEYLNKKVFTSRPDLEAIKGYLIQGATDPALYYVDKQEDQIVLRQIMPDKAQSLFGQDYKSKIIYFSDSIIYSFKPGKDLW
ncbi:MAG: hypothetical protein GF365_01940 [Candidatus Buchananbacteria bacterium]|nr:hypothetical protein [Candidatus Buchananbacteria bacterium]